MLRLPNFRVLFEATPGFYIAMRPDFVAVAVSNDYLRLTLTKRSEILGRSILDFFSKSCSFSESYKDLQASFVRVRESLKSDRIILDCVKVGQLGRSKSEFQIKYWNFVTYPILDKKGKLAHIIHQIEDVTELIEARQKAEEVLKQSLEVRDGFLSIVSHELKTPITSLKLQLQMTKRRVDPSEGKAPPPEKLAKVLDISTRQIDRLTGLLEEMLNVCMIRTGKIVYRFEEVDLVELVQDTVDRFSDDLHFANCSVDITGGGVVKVICDRFRMEQVIVNLLTNAIKYGAGKPIRILLTHNKAFAKIIFQDFGIGIDKADQEKVFERFERVISRSNVSGLGLGLYIVREIVKAHQGFIRLNSKLGKGSTFTVEFPKVTNIF